MTEYVVFDEKTKIWKNVTSSYSDFINQSVADVLLKTIKTIDENKVIDIFYDKCVKKTAGEIFKEAVTLARNLREIGIEKEDVLIVYSLNNEHIVSITLGCILAGVIVNFFDTNIEDAPAAELMNLMEPKVIVYETQFDSKINSIRRLLKSNFPTHSIPIDDKLFKSLATKAEIAAFEPYKIDDPLKTTAFYMLTSGTTGLPKIIHITHAMVLNSIQTWWYNPTGTAQLTGNSVLLTFSMLRWISQIMLILQSIFFGATRVHTNQSPDNCGRDVIDQFGVTHLMATPSVVQDIFEKAANCSDNSLSSLKKFLVLGEPASKALFGMIKAHTRDSEIFNCYGMTEVGNTLRNADENGGKISPGVEVRILGEELEHLGPSQRGRLSLKIAAPLKGYLKLDSAKFFDSDGFFTSSDYGYFDHEQNLHVLGRYEDLIRAEKVLLVPSLVESIVSELPEIGAVRLVGFKKSVEDSNTAVIFYTLKPEFKNSKEIEIVGMKIRDLLKSKLSRDENSVIEQIHFIDLMPLVRSSQKVDRKTLSMLAEKY